MNFIMRFRVAAVLLLPSFCIATNTATEVITSLDYISRQIESSTEQIEQTNEVNILTSEGSVSFSLFIHED